MIHQVKERGTGEPLSEQKPEVLVELIKAKARNLFLTRQLQCSQSVLSTLNEALGGGLGRDRAERLASGLAEGLGGSGCLCGAVTGGVLAIGLFMGKDRRTLLNASGSSYSTALFHREFAGRFGSACCKVLSKRVKHDGKVHFDQCAELTAAAAEIASRIILDAKPHLAKAANIEYLKVKDSLLTGTLNRILPGRASSSPF